MYEKRGFRGNMVDFYDEDNSFINRVLERKTGEAWLCVYQVRHGYMRKTGEAWLYAQNRCGMGICAKQVRHGYMYVYVESVSCSSVFI